MMVNRLDAIDYRTILNHVGHDIQLVGYGLAGTYYRVGMKCRTCDTVVACYMLDVSNEEEEEPCGND